ncbi:MAG: exodeoxyribonuclease VII large subunit [Ignavibacteria bacterium]|nr:exodeoxyribonuclease VII large subunit [Ignavibacteria bacterium]
MQLYANIEEEQPLSVSELNDYVKEILESNFRSVYVLGEISGFKRSFPSGHSYFVIKDEESQISCNLWSYRYNQINFKPEDGKKVLIRGGIRLYKLRGTYSIDVATIEEFGLGDLQLKFEELKKKLADEGLFEIRYKKVLPQFPEKIAIITSETGAVIEDFKRVASKRYPFVKLFLYPVLVQGKGSADSVCSAIERANRGQNEYDIIVIARGGGSIEDLWTFNEESVARAVFKSKIPVVSAIGHEIDFTICDFTADLRAPTPSAAAEMILPDRAELLRKLDSSGSTIRKHVENRIKFINDTLDNIDKSYSFNKPKDIVREFTIHIDEISDNLSEIISDRFKYLNENLENTRKHLLNSFRFQSEKIRVYKKSFRDLDSRMNHLIEERIIQIRSDINQRKKLLENLNPDTILKRGFTYITKGGKIVSRKKNTKMKDIVKIHFTDGEVGAEIHDYN